MNNTAMNEHQHRLWLRMLEMVESYRADAISLAELVGELQGAFDAGEFKDEALIKSFYDRWQPLEITNAVKGHAATRKEVAEELKAMEDFFLEHLITEQLEEPR